jgi:hypothetical protein
LDFDSFAYFADVLEGMRSTGRWVLAQGGWQSNAIGEAILGASVWLLLLVLAVAAFAQIV